MRTYHENERVDGHGWQLRVFPSFLDFHSGSGFLHTEHPEIGPWPSPLSEVVVGVASSRSAVVNLSETVGHFQNGGSGLLLIPFYSIIYARGYGGGRNTR